MADRTPLLIVFSGLPGTGKTTVSRVVAAQLGITLLRIDGIEQAICRANPEQKISTAGYVVANVIAETNLALGTSIIADCVNPVEASRSAWRWIAQRTSARLLDVEVICTNSVEHQRRVEHRKADIDGHVVPSWEAVCRTIYEVRADARLIVDTAHLSPTDAANEVVQAVR